MFTNLDVCDDLLYTVKYFNGEQDFLYVPPDDGLAKQDRAVPFERYFVRKREKKDNLVSKVFLMKRKFLNYLSSMAARASLCGLK